MLAPMLSLVSSLRFGPPGFSAAPVSSGVLGSCAAGASRIGGVLMAERTYETMSAEEQAAVQKAGVNFGEGEDRDTFFADDQAAMWDRVRSDFPALAGKQQRVRRERQACTLAGTYSKQHTALIDHWRAGCTDDELRDAIVHAPRDLKDLLLKLPLLPLLLLNLFLMQTGLSWCNTPSGIESACGPR
jgi:hypothetical protein